MHDVIERLVSVTGGLHYQGCIVGCKLETIMTSWEIHRMTAGALCSGSYYSLLNDFELMHSVCILIYASIFLLISLSIYVHM